MSGVSPSKRGDIDALLSSTALTPARAVKTAAKIAPKAMEPENSALGRIWAYNTAKRDHLVPIYGAGLNDLAVKDIIDLAVMAAFLSDS